MVIFLIFTAVAAVYDIIKQEVPYWVAVFPVAFRIAWIITGHDYQYLIAGAGLFLFLLAGAYFGGMGGADCIYGGLCGLYYGIYGIHVLLISFILSIPQALKRKKYPFIPYILVSSCIMLIILILKGEISWY